MNSFVRRSVLLACLMGLFCLSGCREEDRVPSTDPNANSQGEEGSVPSTDPNMNSQGAGGTDS
ncbi:MAG: hypothetical protein MPJ50_08720 [Pirellulales bacterium]|nr:hypothetical protein [Pirellulales bacterium]